MQFRKERIHNYGLSNVDFKRLGDKKNMKMYRNDMRSTSFGYMGRTEVPYFYERYGYGTNETLQVHSGFKIPKPPNPRTSSVKTSHVLLKKPLREKAEVQRQRVKQLTNSVWSDNKVFTGEDVRGLLWFRQNATSELKNKRHLNKTVGSEEIIKDLGKVKKVNIRRLKRLQQIISSKYENNKKVFDIWDKQKKEYIDATDICYIASQLEIDINLQEAQALIANHTNTKYLTKTQFHHLFTNIGDGVKNDEVDKLKILIKNNIIKLKDKLKEQEVDYNEFKEAIAQILPSPNEAAIRALFEEYDVQKRGKVNYIDLLKGLGNGFKSNKMKDELLYVNDVKRIPNNQLDHIIRKTIKVARLLKSKYKSKDMLSKEIKENCDEYGNVNVKALEEYLLNICKTELDKRVISRKDIEGFLSSFVYNASKMTDGEEVIDRVFSNITQIYKQIYKTQKPLPQNVTTQLSNEEILIDNKRMRELIEEIQTKTFADKKLLYKIFKEYDCDKDGYVSYKDIKERFKKWNINLTDNELSRFIQLVDTNKKGYFDFSSFSTSITKTMAEDLIPLPEDRKIFKGNMGPNPIKVKEDIEYHKTFLTRYNQIRNTFIPEEIGIQGKVSV